MQGQNYLMCFNFEVNGVFFGCHDKCPFNELTSDGTGTHVLPAKGSVSAVSRLRSMEHGVRDLWLPDAKLQPGLWGNTSTALSVGIADVCVEEDDSGGCPVSTNEEEQDIECRVSAGFQELPPLVSLPTAHGYE